MPSAGHTAPQGSHLSLSLRSRAASYSRLLASRLGQLLTPELRKGGASFLRAFGFLCTPLQEERELEGVRNGAQGAPSPQRDSEKYRRILKKKKTKTQAAQFLGLLQGSLHL